MRRATLVAYLAASVIVLGWVLIRYALTPVLGDHIAYLPLVLVVMFVAWRFGTGPAVVATILGEAATTWLVLVPHGGWQTFAHYNVIKMILFLVIAGLVIAMTHWARRSEAATKRYAEKLEKALADAHAATEALKLADARKDEFLAVLAHELRNPLAPMRIAHELSQTATDLKGTLFAQRVIARQLDNLERLVDDLLDVSRITRGKLQLQRQPILLADVIGAAVETSRPLIDARHHELVVSLPEKSVWLDGDPMRLGQAFANLLNNAAKYTPPGGHIELVAELDHQVVITVADTGAGLTQGSIQNVFRMFMQVDAIATRTQGGLGIGLPLVRGIVDLHGGTIEARSEGLGKGSQFIVRLPVIEGPEAMIEPHADLPRSARPMRVLVADDNRDMVDALASMLEHEGHEVRTACDGEAALQAASEFHPDVAVLDIGMPRLTGYQVARKLRDENAEMKLIAVTGWGQAEDRRKSFEAGFDHHLTKPVKPTELLELLH